MATQITCGEGGSTGAEWAERINVLSQVDPRATLVLASAATIADQVVTDSTTKQLLRAFDVIKTERSGFLASVTNASVTNGNTDRFESAILSIGLNLAFSGELELGGFINGVQVGESHFLQGRGVNKPVAIFWQKDYYLDSGDTIDIRVRNAEAGDITVAFKSAHLRIDADWKDIIP